MSGVISNTQQAPDNGSPNYWEREDRLPGPLGALGAYVLKEQLKMGVVVTLDCHQTGQSQGRVRCLAKVLRKICGL